MKGRMHIQGWHEICHISALSNASGPSTFTSPQF